MDMYNKFLAENVLSEGKVVCTSFLLYLRRTVTPAIAWTNPRLGRSPIGF